MEEFMTEIPEDVLDILYELGEEFYFDPLSSIESENYFINMISNYQESDNELETYLREQVKKDFKILEEAPEWIQNADWQYNNGKPMCFVGQIETQSSQKGCSYGMTFYVFWDMETGETKVVTQYD